MNRGVDNKMTISSPLEAHKANTICFDTCAIDVGYENPQFAAIEVEYGEQDDLSSTLHTGKVEKLLTIYEMDLGLNHVVKKQQVDIDLTANKLIMGKYFFLL